MERGEKSMTGRAPVLLQSSQWACFWTCGRKLDKTAGVGRTNNLQPHKLGLEWAWTSKAIGLTSCFVHRNSPFAPLSSKTWRGNQSAERRRCVFNQSALFDTQPHLPGFHECGKPHPTVLTVEVALVRWWAGPAFLVQTRCSCISSLALRVLYYRWTV